MKHVHEALHYDLYQWEVGDDLKMMAMPVELLRGFTKFPCFLCPSDSRVDDQWYLQKECYVIENLTPGVRRFIP